MTNTLSSGISLILSNNSFKEWHIIQFSFLYSKSLVKIILVLLGKGSWFGNVSNVFLPKIIWVFVVFVLIHDLLDSL